ncbi:hypothetical protein Dsin_024759 [Dipteronia sinensis]|uniref:DUF4283 domain-containing protein n=1 Tax=Dipteronia sinensis TaxID=43782 RepID=A0AAD9ZUW3_9ROSI|nr:hypothetical protein Dsin_024759 [Dipteronia sinensis]
MAVRHGGFFVCTSLAGSSVVPSRPHVSLRPHSGEAVDGLADPLFGSSSLSVRGSLPRYEAVVGMVDPFVGGSLPMSSIKGSSFKDLLKAAPIQVDKVFGPLILSKKGGYVAVQVDPSTYKSRLEVCKFSRIGQVVLSSGDKPWKLVDLKVKLQSIWKLNSVWRLISIWRLISLARGIGVPLRLDKATMEGDFGHFMRVLVDIDVSTVPLSSLLLERDDSHSSFVLVEYENLPAFCSTCSSIGHFPNACHWNKSGKGISISSRFRVSGFRFHFFDGTHYFGGDCSASREQQSRSVNTIPIVSRSSAVVPVFNILVVHNFPMDIGSDLSVDLLAGQASSFSGSGTILEFSTASGLVFDVHSTIPNQTVLVIDSLVQTVPTIVGSFSL